MKTKLMILLIVALLLVMAYPVFAAYNDEPGGTVSADEQELQGLYEQMWELREKIAEKRGIELPQNNGGRDLGLGFGYGQGYCGCNF